MKTMKALVKKFAEPGLWMDNVPVPEVGDGDVCIKIRKTSICGTDMHIYNWDAWAQRTIPVPMVVGHEFVGVVTEVGRNVKAFKPGDLVSGEGHLVCGICRNCLAGQRHLCPNTKGVGVNRTGCFAEYLSIPEENVWRCDPGIPEELFCCFDPFGNAVHSALSFDLLGEDVLVTGPGPIGIMSAAVCIHAGARHVVLSGTNPFRLELARKLGIKHAINRKETEIKTVMDSLGMKEGFDVGLEMSGSGPAFNDLVDNMKNGGKIALLGMQARDVSVDWDRVVFGMLTIKGIYGREMYETWYKMTMLLQTGLDISPIITHRFDIDQFEQGFEAMKSGRAGKVILNWDS